MDDTNANTMGKIEDLITRWREFKGWKDEIEVDAEHRAITLATRIRSDGNIYRVFVEGEEERQYVSVFIYGIFSIPDELAKGAYALINAINDRLGVGRLVLKSDGALQYKAIIDVENIDTPSAALIESMLSAGLWNMDHWTPTFGKLVYGNISAEDILSDLNGPK